MSFLPLVLGTAAAVAAATAPLSIDVIVHPRATADRDGSVIVRGMVRCSIETTVDIEVEVVEPLNRSEAAAGTASTDVSCSTTSTPWTAVVPSATDRPFHPGFATVAVRAVGFDPESGVFAGVDTFGSLHLTRSGH